MPDGQAHYCFGAPSPRDEVTVRHQLGVVIAERDEVVAVLREYYTADTAERLRAAKEAVRETLDRFPRKED